MARPGRTAGAATGLSDAAEKQVLLALTGPYKRVAGLASRYVDIPIPAGAPSTASAADVRGATSGGPWRSPSGKSLDGTASSLGTASLGLGGTGLQDGAAVSTTSFKEYKHMMSMNVPPRLAPNERFATPLTAAQEVGWRVHESQRWAALTKPAPSGTTGLSVTGTKAA